jgi:hypothetical protein
MFARLVKSIYGGGQEITTSYNQFTEPPKIDIFSNADLLKGPHLKIGLKPTSRPNTTIAYIMPCCVRVWKESQRPHLFLFSAVSLSLSPHASFKTSSRSLDCQVGGSNPYHHYHLSLVTTSCLIWLHQWRWDHDEFSSSLQLWQWDHAGFGSNSGNGANSDK